jgi:hypothetical protein
VINFHLDKHTPGAKVPEIGRTLQQIGMAATLGYGNSPAFQAFAKYLGAAQFPVVAS